MGRNSAPKNVNMTVKNHYLLSVNTLPILVMELYVLK